MLKFRFRTAMLIAAYEMARNGKLTHEELQAVVACCEDSNCDTCQQCEKVTLLAAQDSGDLTADQANNPKAINWQGLIAFIQAIMAILLPLIIPPKPTPTPTVPGGSGG